MGWKLKTLGGAAVLGVGGFLASTPAMIEVARSGNMAMAGVTNHTLGSAVIETGLTGSGHAFSLMGNAATAISNATFGNLLGAISSVFHFSPVFVAAGAALGSFLIEAALVITACYFIGKFAKKLIDKVRGNEDYGRGNSLPHPEQVQSRSKQKQQEQSMGTEHIPQAQVVPRAPGHQQQAGLQY